MLELGNFPKAFWHQISKEQQLSTHFVFPVFGIMSQIGTVQYKEKSGGRKKRGKG